MKVTFAQLHGLNHPHAQEVGLGKSEIHKSKASKFLLHAILLSSNLRGGELLMALPEVVMDCTPHLCEDLVGAPPPPIMIKNHRVKSKTWLQITILHASGSFLVLQ